MADQPTAGERFINGILPENPVYRQLLGMCPTLAVTAAMAPAMTMVAATAFVLICANVLVSIIRPLLKPHLRILVFTLTIATFVTIADRFLAAYLYNMSKILGPYIPLIIVNCLIISRCEICASKQSTPVALMDALGMSIGFGLALASIATVRELIGQGAWFGLQILPWADDPTVTGGWYPSVVVMILPPGAFLVLGLLLGAVNWIQDLLKQREKKSEEEAVPAAVGSV
jgi:electron transport complex protein RnfE